MRKYTAYRLIFAFTDFCSAFIAWIVFYYIRKQLLDETPEDISTLLLIRASVVGFFWVFLYFLSGFYSGETFRQSRLKEAVKLFQINFIGVIVLFFALLLDDQGVKVYTAYYRTFLSYFFLHFIISVVVKLYLISVFQRLVRRGKVSFNTLIVGSGPKAHEVYKQISEENQHLGLKIVGFVHVFEEMNHGNGLSKIITHFGGFKQLPDLLPQQQIEELVIAVEPSEHKKMEEIFSFVGGYNVRIRIIADLYQMLIGSVRVNNLLGTPLIEIERRLMPIWQRTVKRIFDIVTSLLVLIIGLPFYVFSAIMVKMSSEGPIFYKQERIGQHGHKFNILKFRSMAVDAEKDGPALSSKDDSRITPWGRVMRRTRIDELPQFVNVLIGEMSIVGPRPERQYFIDRIVEKAPYYRHLHKVKPGITSYGMVKFGYAENVDQMIERMKYDILYMENMSLAMDIRVLLYTILIILQRKGK